MNFTTVLAFMAGFITAGILFAFLTQRGWRKVQRDATDRMKGSLKTQDQFYAVTAASYLSALRKLESNDIEGGKRQLALGTANFYHSFGESREFSEFIQMLRRDIELYAKKSELLRSALESKPNDCLT